MKPGNLHVFAFLIWLTIANYSKAESGLPSRNGVLSYFINQTLESLRPNLANLYLENEAFETGPQEFGNCKGNITKVTVEGLEKFYVKTLQTTALDIKNLTIVEENFTAKGFYSINGSVAFPLGKNDIHLFGDGEFGAKFTNFSFSVKMKIRFENGTKIVKDLDMFCGFDRVQVYFKNLMGGGDLEKAFNQIINDVTLPVFNYYKKPALDVIKLKVTEVLNKILNKQK